MEFEVDKKYTGRNEVGKNFVIQITKKYPEINMYGFKVLKGDANSGFEFSGNSVFAKILKPYEDLPRICYVLGGEDTPLKVGEKFKADGHIGKYRIHEEIVEWYKKDYKGCEWVPVNVYDIFEFINHPEKIIRYPQFSDDEIALMREYVKAGYTRFIRGEMRGQDNQLMVYSNANKEGFYLPEKMLPQITIQNSPFDAKKYLESEAKNNG
jgi:hypothetical protein